MFKRSISFCITASGDSMEPVIKHGSLLVIDSSQTNIVDGKMYVFQQDDFLRVKIFSYEKIKLESVVTIKNMGMKSIGLMN
ncbi:S24 family peptidase [Vibrio parahaemolyticus]|nr:S24 family peptidase [Vibrio parahaemolyticus]MDN4716588.1 S24 family peptidase [Vibrio parahaemolyticus]MDN4723906.1 S24 family peptidase [Vibrio parahaemolyticus]MDN4726460.1 S24 family peptidase [Vibrio parahaemolyticus]MDN4735479.1 S24 family peptidase [Vibrio parahaemolyticus]